MTNFRRPGLAIALLGMLVFGGVILGRFMLDWYLQGDVFRQRIAAAVGRILKGEGTFTPLQRVGGTLYSDQFSARGTGGAFFSELRADQIRAEFDWRSLLHRMVRIDELTVQELDVQFAAPSRATEKREPTRAEWHDAVAKRAAWDVDLRKARVAQSSWRWQTNNRQQGNISGSGFTLTPSDGSWLIEASGGKVSQPGWPEMSLDFAKLRYTGSSLFVTESLLRNGTGKIAVTGEVAFNKAADMQAQFDSLPLPLLLPDDWRLRLSGNLSGTAKVHAPFSGEPIHAEGSLGLANGQLEAVPLLDEIARFTRTDRFRRMALTKGSLLFTRDEKLITAKEIVLESEGLMRIEGACTIINGQIDGVFQVGVTAASLQWLPGSQARVFTISHDGYFWTPLRLTGPVAHPTEDLTPRLVAAAADEMLENAQDALRETTKSILDLLPH